MKRILYHASYELALVYLPASLLCVLAGPGRLSLDAVLFDGPRDDLTRHELQAQRTQ